MESEGEVVEGMKGGCPPTACCAIDLFRLPITGVDTVEDTNQLAGRILHEWRKTRDEYRPEVLMVDLTSDLLLYRILKARGLPVAALPEAESRNRHVAQSIPCRLHSSTCEGRGTPSPSCHLGRAASMSFRTRLPLHIAGRECWTGSARDTSQGLLRPGSLKHILRAGISLILVPCRKMVALVFGVSGGSSDSLHNV